MTIDKATTSACNETKRQATVSSDCIYRKDAIDAIHEDADWLAAQGSDWQAERMERDKSILMSLPSAEKVQLSGEDATFDCISRQAVLDLPIKRDICWFDGSVDEWINVEDIKELPSVQQCMTAASNTMVSETVKIPVMDGTTERLPSAEPEIIRCRDCKHHDGIRCFRWNSTIITGFDDFCSNAERRSEEDERNIYTRYNSGNV